MVLSQQIRGWLRRMGEHVRAHPLLAGSIAYLVVKQVLVLWIFMPGIQLPPNMIISLVGAGLLTVPWAFALRGGWRLTSLAAIEIGYGLMLLCDLLYFRQFHDLPSIASLQHADLVGDVDGVVESLLHPFDAFLFAGVAAVLGVAVARPAWLQRQQRISWRRVAVLAVVGLGLIAAVGGTTRKLRKPFAGHTVIVSRIGPVGYHLFDAGSLVAKKLRQRFVDVEEELGRARELLERRKQPDSDLAGIAKGKNVIVVQLESWQAFPIGLEVGGKEVTPHFNRLARESIHFTRFFAQVGQGTTSDAELLQQCSLYPTRSGSVYYSHATNDLRCLPEILKEAGYETIAMHANRRDFWNRNAMYPTVGIETYYDERSFSLQPHIGMGLGDAEFFQEAVDKLLETPEPYWVQLVSLTSHGPFEYPNLPRDLEHGPFTGTMIANYLDAVRYTDAALGAFVERLREEGILDRSILVVYGDHMGVGRDNSNVGDFLGLRKDDGVGWFLTERRVPGLIRLPGGAHAGPRDHVAGQIDIAPTIAALLGLPPKGAAFMGRNLLAGGPGHVALPNGTVVTDDRIYLSADGGYGMGGCFSLPEMRRLPGEACDPVVEKAHAELAVSWTMIELDLVARLASSRTSALTQVERSLPPAN